MPAPGQARYLRSQGVPHKREQLRHTHQGACKVLRQLEYLGSLRGRVPQNHLFWGGVARLRRATPPLSRAEGAHQRLRMQKNLVLALP